MNEVQYTDTKYPQNTKSQYDLVSRRLVMNGKPINRQAVSYQGNFINTFGLNYTIVAHEDLFLYVNTFIYTIIYNKVWKE